MIVPPPQKVAVVADSSISLPAEMLQRWGITVAPLEIHFGDRVYRDGVDLDSPTFYHMLTLADRPPTTSAPKPASFLEAFRQARVLAPQLLCLTLSSTLSAVHQSALLAAELAGRELPETRVTVLDTGTAAGAEALVALEAARAAKQGMDAAAVEEICRKNMEKVNLLAFLDTLHYLSRSGRVPRIAAWMGDALQVKPMLELARNDVHLVARPRTKRRAIEDLLHLVVDRTRNAPVVVNVIHAADAEGALDLYGRVSERFTCEDIFISEFSPALGVHTGPGLLGVAFYPAT